MTTEEQPSRQQLMDEAASWLARLDSGAADPAEFEIWRNADPRRASAFVQIANAAQALDRAKPVLRDPKGPPKSKPIDRRRILVSGIAFAAASTGALAVLWDRRAGAATLVGVRQTVNLPNGATLELNTDSKAQWRSDKDLMHVWLERGEIALTVHSSEQSCVIHSGGSIADVGVGKVNARLRGKLLDLTVLAGQCVLSAKVAPFPTKPKTLTVTLRTNQAALSGIDSPVVRVMAPQDVQLISGWPTGELVFEGQTLETAVGEYNRYLVHKIIIADPSLASLRLGGRFSSTNAAVFLDALNSSFGIRASTDESGTTVLTKS